MADFVQLAEIPQLTKEECDFLLNQCDIKEGYYDEKNNDFVIRRKR